MRTMLRSQQPVRSHIFLLPSRIINFHRRTRQMKPLPSTYWLGQATDLDLSKGQPLASYQQIPPPPPLEQGLHKQSSALQVQGSSVTPFHIYKAPGCFDKDNFITGDDEKQILYVQVQPLSDSYIASFRTRLFRLFLNANFYIGILLISPVITSEDGI